MPGAMGVFAPNNPIDVKSVFDRLIQSMLRHSKLRQDVAVADDHRWAFGRVHLGILEPHEQLSASDDVLVLFHGDLHNAVHLDATLAEKSSGNQVSCVADIVRRAYLVHGVRTGLELDGAFLACILDRKRQRLLIINDLVGTFPLYWCQDKHMFCFSSELRSVLAGVGQSPTLSSAGLADFVKFGFLTGTETLADGVHMLMNDATLELNLKNFTVELHAGRRLESMLESTPKSSSHSALDNVTHCFNEAVNRAMCDDHRFAISISGGMDSRAILSAMNGRDERMNSFTDGVRGCADEVIGEQLARLLGTRHHFLELDARYLDEFLDNLREMVNLTDGMYLSHGLTEMLAFPHIRDMNYEVLIRGHGGELAKTALAWPLHTDDTVGRIDDRSELISYLLRRIDYITSDELPEGVFTAEWQQQMQGRSREALEQSLANFNGTTGDACTLLYLKEHHRRFTIASMELFRNEVEVRLPFVDQGFLQALWSLPVAARETTAIHKRIITSNAPMLGRVRNSNTGAPACAHPLVETIIDKINTLLARFNFPGFRHYHDFSNWMKRSLLDTIEQELLSDQSIGRGVLNPAGLRQLIAETRNGVRDHGYLLQILLNIEYWQQQNRI